MSDTQYTKVREENPLEELTASKVQRLLKEYPELWEIYPELYKTDSSGNFILTKAGVPARKQGKLPGSPHNLHSETKKKRAAKQARDRVREEQQRVKKLEAKVKEAQKKAEKTKEALNKLDGRSKNQLITKEELDRLPQAVRDQIANEESEVIFKPNPGPQEHFLGAGEKDVLFGGAAGGGKSYAMLVDPLRFCHIGDARALLIRRTMPELRELIDKSFELYPKAFPGAKFRQQDKIWTFPSGAKLEFGYCEKDSDVYRYQGQAYSWIGFDELTQWPSDFCWNYLATRLRTINPNITPYLRATANPGNIGGWWVKKRYIDPCPPNTSFVGPDGMSRKFIPSRLSDNPYLYENGDYEQILKGMPTVLRQQLLEGNWDVVEGAAFPEFDPNIHVIPPFEIPAHWERLKGIDYGYASESACVWLTVDPEDGTIIVYRELYKKGLTGSELGAIIREMELPDVRSVPGVLDTAAWSQMGGGYKGPTVGEVLVQMGHKLRRADKNRKAGKIQVHERLAKNMETGRPKLQIFSSCPNTIREMQALPAAKNDPEDVDTHAQDHAYDALRYALMSRPRIEGHMARLARFKSEVYQPADSIFGY
jgi:hypothetical protein